VISSRDDLSFDDRKHLNQSFLLYTYTPVCSALISETLAAHKDIRFENVVAYALDTPFGEKLTGEHPVFWDHLANGTMCHLAMLTQGTPFHMAHVQLPGGSSVVPLVGDAAGEHSEARRTVQLALYKHSAVEVVVINYYAGKPVVVEYSVSLESAIRPASIVLEAGGTFCFQAAAGYPVKVTSDYRYTSDEVVEATRGMTNAQNRLFVEGGTGAGGLAGDPSTTEGKYNAGSLRRPAFSGIPLYEEVVKFTTSIYLPYYEYDAADQPILSNLLPAEYTVFGLRGQESVSAYSYISLSVCVLCCMLSTQSYFLAYHLSETSVHYR